MSIMKRQEPQPDKRLSTKPYEVPKLTYLGDYSKRTFDVGSLPVVDFMEPYRR